jgi:hypothetical protein
VTLVPQELTDLKVIARSVGFDLVDVVGDGDCLFQAVCVSLADNSVHTTKNELRQRLSNYLRDHPCVNDDIDNPRSNFIDANYLQLEQHGRTALWAEYVRRIGLNCRQGGIWGDEIALQVF